MAKITLSLAKVDGKKPFSSPKFNLVFLEVRQYTNKNTSKIQKSTQKFILHFKIMNHPLSRGGNSKLFFQFWNFTLYVGHRCVSSSLKWFWACMACFFSIHSLATSVVSIFNTHTHLLAGCTFKTFLPLFTNCGGDNQINGAFKLKFWDEVAISSALNHHDESTSCQFLSAFALFCNMHAGWWII